MKLVPKMLENLHIFTRLPKKISLNHVGVLQTLILISDIWNIEDAHYITCGTISQFVQHISSHILDMWAVNTISIKFFNTTKIL